MKKWFPIDLQRAISVFGALAIGIWLPVRIIGLELPFGLNMVFSFGLSLFAANNAIMFLREQTLPLALWREWLTLGFLIDAFCAIPIALMQIYFFGEATPWILGTNLVAVRHINEIKKILDRFDNLSPVVYRLMPVFVSLPLLVHMVACGWIFLGEGNSEPVTDLLFRYIRACYWAMTTLTTVGYGDIVAKTMPQMIYAGIVQFSGVGVFGFIVSNVATHLHRAEAAREHHMESVDRLETFMQMQGISPHLRQNVRTYFHYLWTHKRGYQERSVLENLPSKIQSELFFEINKSIVSKVDFLKGASPELIEDLMLALEPKIFVPGEKIFRVDEPGSAIYFIHSGVVEIRSRENALIATLTEGKFFGEMALISDRPRSANARAATYCEVYLLSKDAFSRVMATYPEFKKHVEEIAQSRKN